MAQRAISGMEMHDAVDLPEIAAQFPAYIIWTHPVVP